jgi:polyisoprenoid-binding protein YceI
MLARTGHGTKAAFTTLAIFALTANGPCSAASYAFDKKRTEVRFAYTMGLATGRGRFTSIDGTAEFDEAAPEKTSVESVIATASLTADEPVVESELKGSEFFNADVEPQIRFKSRSVRAQTSDAAEMTGDITVNGITKPVVLQVSLRPHDNPALKYSQGAREFVATTHIRRSEFNMTAFQSMVGDDVQIEIDAILRQTR